MNVLSLFDVKKIEKECKLDLSNNEFFVENNNFLLFSFLKPLTYIFNFKNKLRLVYIPSKINNYKGF